MSKNMLEFHLNQLEGAITFQIVDQSNEVTNYLKRVGTHYAPNGFKVKVDRFPEIDLDKKMIFLRGSRDSKDLKVCRVQNLGGQKQVNKVANDIQKALEDVVAAAKGQRNKRPFVLADTFIVNLEAYDPFYELSRDPRIIIIGR